VPVCLKIFLAAYTVGTVYAVLHAAHRAFSHAASANGACDRAETLQSDYVCMLLG